MSLGSYGNIRPADVSPSDMDVILIYTESRENTTPTITRLNPQNVITPINGNEALGTNPNEILGGMYNLSLPSTIFNTKGFYNVYIRPAQIRTNILDCGVLSSSPDIKGIVLDINSFPPEYLDKFINNGLVGYRIEYINQDGTKLQNVFRVVTSCFLCEPVNQNLTNSSQKSIRYRYNNAGTLLFLTLSPSAAPNTKPNSIPFIGLPNQNIIISNTFFDPLNVEIEMVDYDMESIAIGLFGNQVRDVNTGVATTYDFDNNIFTQYDVYEKQNNNGQTLYEIKRKRDTVDLTQNFEDIVTE